MTEVFMTDPPSLPEHGYIRLKTVLALIPVSKSTFYQGIRDGRFPAPVRILPNVSACDLTGILDRAE
jgi:prophage regulatory protein